MAHALACSELLAAVSRVCGRRVRLTLPPGTPASLDAETLDTCCVLYVNNLLSGLSERQIE
jgi:hypothetical protein